MVKRSRAVLIALLTIALCFSLIAAGTYALYTDSVNLTTHLVSGSMDITLKRTNLTTKTLSDAGYLATNEYPADVDFSNTTDRNVFEITNNTLIAPGCSFDAEMTLSNASDVAFIWWIEIRYDDSENLALADQLKVTVTAAGTPSEAFLSAGLTIGSENAPVGTLAKSGSSVFNVKVEFINDNSVNNSAQGQQVDFDLIVHAVQATEAV